MSESNQKLVIIFVFVFMLSIARLYFGYNQFEIGPDVTTAITLAGAAAGLSKLAAVKT